MKQDFGFGFRGLALNLKPLQGLAHGARDRVVFAIPMENVSQSKACIVVDVVADVLDW